MAFIDQPRNYVVPIASAAAGFIASRLLGENFWLTAILVGVAYFAIGRWRPATSIPLRAAVALLLGHCLWMVIGVFLLPAQLWEVALDLVIGFALAPWILLAPSRAPVVILTQLGQGEPMIAALAMHMLLRAGIVVAATVALRRGLSRDRDIDAEKIFS